MDAATNVIIALGSNLGDRQANLHEALHRLDGSREIEVLQVSAFRESVALTPNGTDPDAPRYLNGVASLRTTLPPMKLMNEMHRIEEALGRVRDRHWGDRTLDLDLIVYADAIIDTSTLVVPHPRAHQRDFVLAPWLEIDPNAAIPGHGSVSMLHAALTSRVGSC